MGHTTTKTLSVIDKFKMYSCRIPGFRVTNYDRLPVMFDLVYNYFTLWLTLYNF